MKKIKNGNGLLNNTSDFCRIVQLACILHVQYRYYLVISCKDSIVSQGKCFEKVLFNKLYNYQLTVCQNSFQLSVIKLFNQTNYLLLTPIRLFYQSRTT